MTTAFPGTFAGKMVFCSAVSGKPNLYLSFCKRSGGQHDWKYYPGMNATRISPNEKHLLYLYPDGYYRIQCLYPDENFRRTLGYMPWLSLEPTIEFIQYDVLENAAAFKIGGNPFGSRLSVQTKDGDKTLYYLYQSNLMQPNLLGTIDGEDHYSAFAPTLATPSLDTVRQQKKAVAADFSGVILVGQDLSQGIDFTSANFVGGQLAGVNFGNATLDKADLSDTDLRGFNWGSPASAAGVDLSGAVAQNCVLGGQANGLNCVEANFSSADLTGANLSKLNLQKANFAGAILNGAILSEAVLNQAVLNNTVAIKASFAGAKLIDAQAQMGIFTRAVFDGADLTRVKMGSRSYLFDVSNNVSQIANELDTSQYPQSATKKAFSDNGINLDGGAVVEILTKGQSWLIRDPSGPYKLTLTNTVIQVFNINPNITPAILYGASLKDVKAPTASLAGADLRGVRWHSLQSDLSHADLQDASFNGALLVSMNFTQSIVSGVDFSDSIIIQGKFTGCIAGPGGSQRAISFENAHLEGADFSKATFSGAILTGAVVSLGSGVPLLFLPPDAAQNLTTDKIGVLSPAFRQAGFDLGASPKVDDNSQWILDNGNCPDRNAPRQYIVKKKSPSGFNVYGSTGYLFSLLENMAALLKQSKASQLLVGAFTQNNYKLVLDAPITTQNAWKITVGSNPSFLRPYLFNVLQVQKEATRLVVYGIATVRLENVTEYPSDVGFGATANLLNALSPNSVGPGGVPVSWISQELIDALAFCVAM